MKRRALIIGIASQDGSYLVELLPAKATRSTGWFDAWRSKIPSTLARLREVFDRVGLDWKQYIKTDQIFCRPAEVDLLPGDYSKAKEKLGWPRAFNSTSWWLRWSTPICAALGVSRPAGVAAFTFSHGT